MAQQKSKKPPQTKLFLKVLDPIKEGGKWLIKAIATVLKGTWPEATKSVQFYLDGDKYEGAETTEADGRVTKKIYADKPGAYFIEAKMEETPFASSAQTVVIAEPGKTKTPAPASIRVHKEGRQGNYHGHVQVLDSEREGVPKAKVCVIDSATGEKIKTITVNAGGVGEYKIFFTEVEKIFAFTVLGTAVVERVVLFGHWPKKPKVNKEGL